MILVWWPWWHPQQKREFSILSSRFYIVQIKNLDHKRINTALQCGAPKIAKLVYNSNNYGLWYL